MPGSGKGQTVSGHSKTMTSSITVAIVCSQSGSAFYRGPGVILCRSIIPGKIGRQTASDCRLFIREQTPTSLNIRGSRKLAVWIRKQYSHKTVFIWSFLFKVAGLMSGQSPRAIKSHSLKTLSTFQTSNKINQQTKRFSTISSIL